MLELVGNNGDQFSPDRARKRAKLYCLTEFDAVDEVFVRMFSSVYLVYQFLTITSTAVDP